MKQANKQTSKQANRLFSILLGGVLSLFITSLSNAQIYEECIVIDEEGPYSEEGYTYSADSQYASSFSPIVFNLRFWKILDPNGNVPTGAINITEEDALKAVQTLNIEYNKINIFFKYLGLDEII